MVRKKSKSEPAFESEQLSPELPGEPALSGLQELSINRALKLWLADLVAPDFKDETAYRGAVLAFARETHRDIGGNKLLSDITISDLADARARLLAYLSRDHSRLIVVNQTFFALRQFFIWCIEHDLCYLSRELILLCLDDAGSSLPISQPLGVAENVLTSIASPASLPAIPLDLNTLDDAALRQLAGQYIQALKATPLYRQAHLLQEAVNTRATSTTSARARPSQLPSPPAPPEKNGTRSTSSNNNVSGANRTEPRVEIH